MKHLERTYSSPQLFTTTINITSACMCVDSWNFLTFLSLSRFTSFVSTGNLQAHWPGRQVCYLYFPSFALNPISQSHPSKVADHLLWSLFSLCSHSQKTTQILEVQLGFFSPVDSLSPHFQFIPIHKCQVQILRNAFKQKSHIPDSISEDTYRTIPQLPQYPKRQSGQNEQGMKQSSNKGKTR